MVIEKDILDRWKALRSRNDTKEMSFRWKRPKVVYATVLRTGECGNDRIFEEIMTFYSEKADNINRAKEALSGITPVTDHPVS